MKDIRILKQKIAEIEEKKDLLENVKKLLPVDEDYVEVKVRGTPFRLPKKLFEEEHRKIVKVMEKEINDLEKDPDFN